MIPYTGWVTQVLVWAGQLADIGVRLAVICVLVPLALWLWHGKAKPVMPMEKGDDE